VKIHLFVFVLVLDTCVPPSSTFLLDSLLLLLLLQLCFRLLEISRLHFFEVEILILLLLLFDMLRTGQLLNSLVENYHKLDLLANISLSCHEITTYTFYKLLGSFINQSY